MERYSDTLVVALATAIAVLDVFFILVAVPESLPDKVRPSSWGAPINWEQADPFAVSIYLKILLKMTHIFCHNIIAIQLKYETKNNKDIMKYKNISSPNVIYSLFLNKIFG